MRQPYASVRGDRLLDAFRTVLDRETFVVAATGVAARVRALNDFFNDR